MKISHMEYVNFVESQVNSGKTWIGYRLCVRSAIEKSIVNDAIQSSLLKKGMC